MTIAGVVITFVGFLIALFSVGMTADNTMRLIIVLVGIAVSLDRHHRRAEPRLPEQGHLEEMIKMKKAITLFAFVLSLAPFAASQTPAAAPPAPSAAPAAAPPPAPVHADHRRRHQEHRAPAADARAKGDPDGGLTGTVSDITVADSKKGLTIGDIANQIGQNKIAVNFVWTLITGFLVMFMQAGFAIVETGLCRAKNANHTMMMNFMVYGVGMLAYWLIGFAVQFGGYGANANLGGTPVLNKEFAITLFGKPFGLFGQGGFFLTNNHSYDVMVMVLFLFQMVFMDTALTIVTGAAAERWKYAAFVVSSFVMGAFTYPIFGNWAWGGGWLANLGTNFGLGHGYADFAGSGVVHAVGGITALGGLDDHRSSHRQVHAAGQARCHARSRPGDRAHRLLHPGLRLVRIQSRFHLGRFEQRQPAHRLHRGQHHAGRYGRLVRRAACTCGCATASRTHPCPATACWRAWWPSRRPAASSIRSAQSSSA